MDSHIMEGAFLSVFYAGRLAWGHGWRYGVKLFQLHLPDSFKFQNN